MQDQLTARQRKKALSQGQDVDRLPIALFHPEFAAKYAGLSYFDSHHQAKNLAQREINMYKKLGLDEISVMYVKLPKTSRNLIRSFKDIDRLDLDDYRYDKDRRQQINRHALDIIYDEVGQDAVIAYGIAGPLTLAQGLLPIKELMKGLIRTPDLVHQVLRFCTDFILELIGSLEDYQDLQFSIYDPVASGSLISAKSFEKFCLPYSKEIVAVLKEKTDRVNMHICGDTSDRLDLFAQTGIDSFSLDQKVDLAFAKETIGDRVSLQGNVDPVAVLMQGHPQSVREAVKDCFDKASDSPKGFVLRSGCGVPYSAPVENVEAFVEAGKYYGHLAVQN